MRLLAIIFLCLLTVPAHADWREANSAHFVVYSQESEKTLREFAENLERYDAVMRLLRNLPPSDPGKANRVTVFMVSGQNEVAKLAGRDRSVAGFYIPRAGGSVAIVPARSSGERFDLSAESILLHEYAHHFMYQNFPSAYPGWFREGFAEFNAGTKFERDGSVVVGHFPVYRAYGINSGAMPVKKLLSLNYGKMQPEEVDALYGRGWLLTHLLTFRPDRQGQLTTYLAEINKGTSGIDAATRAFGDLGKLQGEADRYLRGSRIAGIRIPPTEIAPSPVTIRKLNAAENAIMPVKIRSRRGVSPEQARALIVEARSAAAPYPDNAFVQAALAEAEYDAGYLAEAESAADRALAADPKYIDALLYKARTRMARLVAAKSTGAAAWKEARSWLIAANRADPDHPEALKLFYESFAEAGAQPTANAGIGLVYAHSLAPYDTELRMLVAHRYLADGKASEARRTIAPMAFDPHRGAFGTWLTEVLATLDTSGTAAALALWDKGPPKENDGKTAKGT